MENNTIIGKYLHFKGNEYEVLYIAKNSETQELMVVYKSIKDNSIWIRPASMWNDIVEYNNKKVKRFTKIN